MKKRFTEEQIIGFLREAEAGLPRPTKRLTSGAIDGSLWISYPSFEPDDFVQSLPL